MNYQPPHWLAAFDKLRPQIEKALDYGGNTHTFDDLIAKVRLERFKLFWTSEPVAILLVEIIHYPQFKCAQLYLAAGDMTMLCQLEPFALKWAQEQGCTQAWATGRPGWERISRLWKYGWKRRPQAWFTKAL